MRSAWAAAGSETQTFSSRVDDCDVEPHPNRHVSLWNPLDLAPNDYQLCTVEMSRYSRLSVEETLCKLSKPSNVYTTKRHTKSYILSRYADGIILF